MYVCMYVCVYIYIYIYIYMCNRKCRPQPSSRWVGPLSRASLPENPRVRPIPLLTLSLLTVLDSNFPGTPLWAWEFHL